MAASVPLRNVPLLALGALAMFGYVTSVAARYLHQSLGVPSALAITGVLIIGLAVVSARLMREGHPPEPGQMDAEKPPPVILPPKPTESGADKTSISSGILLLTPLCHPSAGEQLHQRGGLAHGRCGQVRAEAPRRLARAPARPSAAAGIVSNMAGSLSGRAACGSAADLWLSITGPSALRRHAGPPIYV